MDNIFEVSKRMRVGFTASTFDLLHAGHVAMLEAAKSECEYLIVGLQTDPTIDRPTTKNKPVQTMFERFVQISAVSHVDMVVPYSTEAELIQILKTYPIYVRILGEEYMDKDFTGRKECEDLGIKICYNSRNHDFSTTSLRERVMSRHSESK